MHRYYDPATGQFLSVDPAVTATQAPYSYSTDNPTNETDPSGLFGLSSITGAVSDLYQGAVEIYHGVDTAAHNPIVQTAVTIGSCTLGGALGCGIANAGFAALNAYSDYGTDGGFTSTWFAQTGLNVAASAVDMTSLRGLIGSAENYEDELGNPLLTSQISKLSQIPLSTAMKITLRNILVGGSVALLNYFIQSELINAPSAGASELACAGI